VAQSHETDIVNQLIAGEEQVFCAVSPAAPNSSRRPVKHLAAVRRPLADRRTASRLDEPRQRSKVYDVDGTEYVDMHGGYGASIAGMHIRRSSMRSARGSQGYALRQPTEDAIWIAGELARRFDLPLWRFANSGTEATMDAVTLPVR